MKIKTTILRNNGSKALLTIIIVIQFLLADYGTCGKILGYNDQLVENERIENATRAARAPQPMSLSSAQKCAQCILEKQSTADYCKYSIYKPGTCCLKSAVASAETCQSSQPFYFGRGYDGEFWSPTWLAADGETTAEFKKVRLWTYQDDVEGRRNNPDEETEEAASEKKEEDQSNAQVNPD